MRSVLMGAAGKRTDSIPKLPLSVLNAVPGQNGIYNIVDEVGGTFQAYVDMTTDGGYWIQTVYWTAPPANGQSIPMNNLMVKDLPLRGFSSSPTVRPSVPSGRISKNIAKEWMFKSENPNWTSLMGAWQVSPIFNQGFVISPTQGFPIRTNVGNKTMFGRGTGWNTNTNMTDVPSFWPAQGNSSPCGGMNRVGTTKPCPVFAANDEWTNSGYRNHADPTSVKTLYVRASNYGS